MTRIGDNRLAANYVNPAFEAFYCDHLRPKLLHLRAGRRIALAGNYLISRLGYLRRVFPDARFVVLVREPTGHIIASLMRQHRIFSAAQRSGRVCAITLPPSAISNSGLDRAPINMGDDGEIAAIQARWAEGDEPGAAGRSIGVMSTDSCIASWQPIRRWQHRF